MQAAQEVLGLSKHKNPHTNIQVTAETTARTRMQQRQDQGQCASNTVGAPTQNLTAAVNVCRDGAQAENHAQTEHSGNGDQAESHAQTLVGIVAALSTVTSSLEDLVF